MITDFDDYLNEKMKDPQFKKMFEEEKRLLDLSMLIIEAREQQKLTQSELAEKSQVTQRQLSKIENCDNYNMRTFIKVSNALGLDLTLSGIDYKQAV